MATTDKERAALEAQVKSLKELIEVAKAVVSTLDLDTVLQAILTSAMHFAETPAGSVGLYDEKKQELSLHAHSGLTADFIKNERWEVSPGGLTEQILKAGEIFFVEDVTTAGFSQNPLMVKEGIRSLVCVPLVFGERIMGVLYLDDFVPRVFDKERMNLLSVLSSFAAMAIYNAKLHNRTKLLAITDALTGLYNHRHFHQIFSTEMGRCKRYRKDLSIIMLDVDDFKKFNDTFGHSSGDLVLAAIGDLIGGTLRGVDYAFRYGGEEFIVLLPETRLEQAVQVAERLRQMVETETKARFTTLAGQGVTVSVGVAAYPVDADKKDKLFEKVDALLYQAKVFGKNKVYYSKEDAAE
jgi:diguanylate cyclase (GGDEF)-like protein